MILYGASGHGKVIADILHECGESDIRFWDDAPNRAFAAVYDVTPPPADYSGVTAPVIISIGSNHTRKRIADKLNVAVSFGTAVHPKSVQGARVSMGEGTVVMAGVVINIDTTIGKHCIINTNASVDHDCSLADYVHISPNVALCGNVTIGEGTHMGAGSVAIPGIKIGKWCCIGAGAVIIRDVPDFATVVGNPGKVIKLNTE